MWYIIKHMSVRPYLLTAFTIGFFFIFLFAYTKLAGPIPFYINSITSQKNTTFDVSGEGSVFVVPDIAKVNAGISANASTVQAAQDQINRAINKVSEAVKKLGVDAKDIQTQNYNINPTYDYSGSSQRITGYQASTNLSIKVRNIEKVNDVVDAATAAGANNVGGVAFDVADKTKAENQAREKAIAQAKSKAQTAAKAGGFSLGRLINYSENSQTPIPVRAMGALLNKAESAPTQVEPGTNEVKISVTLSYEIR